MFLGFAHAAGQRAAGGRTRPKFEARQPLPAAAAASILGEPQKALELLERCGLKQARKLQPAVGVLPKPQMWVLPNRVPQLSHPILLWLGGFPY